MTRRLTLALVAVSVVTLLLAVAQRLDPARQGLTAQYFSNATWTSPAAATIAEMEPSTEALTQAWGESPPEQFSTTWTGAILVLHAGTYTFATDTDGGASVVIDGRLTVANGGPSDSRLTPASVHLDRGAHALLIQYVRKAGSPRFTLLWSRDGSAVAPVPSWTLRRRASRSVVASIASLMLTGLLATSQGIWVGTLCLLAAAIMGGSLVRLRQLLQRKAVWTALRWILAGSVVLNLAGLWWGLPGQWAAGEVGPEYVVDALSHHFANGWFDTYPPVHFYVLALATSPVLILQALGLVSATSGAAYITMLVICRLVSTAASIGTVVATCLCGTEAFGKNAGIFAAAIIALTAPFLYYAKTANVDAPYVFWFALSLVFYARLLEHGRIGDYIRFAVATTLAVCTKDQAYGLYLLAPFVIVYELWRTNRQTSETHPIWRALGDRRLLAAAATAAVLFVACDNLVFNFGGFLDHVRYIVGPGNTNYRGFEPTLAGRVALLRLTIHLTAVSMGWPLFLAGLIGFCITVATPRLRRFSIWFGTPIVAYYFGFIDVILYDYDRFVLPICLILALFGGVAFDGFLKTHVRGRMWRWLLIEGVFAYALLYASTVDVLMMADSRYSVEAWMRAHATTDTTVAMTGPGEYLPRLGAFARRDIGSVEDLAREHPMYYVLNADYGRAVPADTTWGELIAGLQRGGLGYRLVARVRSPSPWPWLPAGHPDLVGPRSETAVFDILRNINPTIEVFQCDVPACGPRAAR